MGKLMHKEIRRLVQVNFMSKDLKSNVLHKRYPEKLRKKYMGK